MLGENIKKFRVLKGMSLRDFGKAVNMSQTAIQKYENNILNVDGEKLLLFSSVLGCSVADLMKDNSKRKSLDLNFRKKEALKGKRLEQLKEIVNDRVNNYLDVLDLNNIEKKELKKYKVSSIEDASNAASLFRKDNKLNELLPLVNLCNIIENLGIYVIIIDNKEDYFKGFDGVSEMVDGYPFICISSCINKYRQRFTLAHELGHLLLDINEELDKEKACNAFASSLLLSKEAVIQEFGLKRIRISNQEYEIVRNEYQVSIKAIINRLEKLGVITYNNAKLAYIDFNSRYKQDEEKSGCIEESRKYDQLVLRLLNQELITNSRFEELMKGYKLVN